MKWIKVSYLWKTFFLYLVDKLSFNQTKSNNNKDILFHLGDFIDIYVNNIQIFKWKKLIVYFSKQYWIDQLGITNFTLVIFSFEDQKTQNMAGRCLFIFSKDSILEKLRRKKSVKTKKADTTQVALINRPIIILADDYILAFYQWNFCYLIYISIQTQDLEYILTKTLLLIKPKLLDKFPLIKKEFQDQLPLIFK